MDYNSFSSTLWTAENAALAFFFLIAGAILIPSLIYMALDWVNQGKKTHRWNEEKHQWENYSTFFQRQQKPPTANCRWKTYLDKRGIGVK